MSSVPDGRAANQPLAVITFKPPIGAPLPGAWVRMASIFSPGVIIERCCGLDVHQETVVACLLIGAPGDRPTKEVRTFRTVTRDLEVLRDWLAAAGVTHVGMESTGVYWRPVYAVLEGHFDLIVGNARHIRNVP